MASTAFGFSFTLFTALIVILGDSIIKLAAASGSPVTSHQVILGCLLYAASGVLWYYAMRHVTLAQGGVAFSMLTLVALALIGALVFDEPIRTRESLGIGCALVSMVLMMRIA